MNGSIKENKNILVFHLLPKMEYNKRMIFSLSLVCAGLILQYLLVQVFPWILFVLVGNLLLLVKGYDNRISFSGFNPEASWVKADHEKVSEVVSINKKLLKWDRSGIDITSGLGALFFTLMFLFLLAASIAGIQTGNHVVYFTCLNAMVLFFPFWFTGVKRILTTPGVVNKIRFFQFLHASNSDVLKEHTMDYMLLLKGDDKKLPMDVKVKMKFRNQPDEFMGMYGQISMNDVNGAKYPYFYVVFVAKMGFGLPRLFEQIELPRGVVKEYEEENEVEIIVLRQKTTKDSGYHTKPKAANKIFLTGIRNAERLICS